jgi:hypothetical protein
MSSEGGGFRLSLSWFIVHITSNIKKLMKDIHQNAIKYLTYLILNKIKLDNKQAPVPHHNNNGLLGYH